MRGATQLVSTSVRYALIKIYFHSAAIAMSDVDGPYSTDKKIDCMHFCSQNVITSFRTTPKPTRHGLTEYFDCELIRTELLVTTPKYARKRARAILKLSSSR